MIIESFLPDSVKVVLTGAIAGVFVLSQAARRYPHVEWLQKFHLRDYRTEEQKRKARRAGNILAGIELIGIGLLIPAGYFVLTVMFFSEMETAELLIVGALSLVCIGFGILAISQAGSADRREGR